MRGLSQVRRGGLRLFCASRAIITGSRRSDLEKSEVKVLENDPRPLARSEFLYDSQAVNVAAYGFVFIEVAVKQEMLVSNDSWFKRVNLLHDWN